MSIKITKNILQSQELNFDCEYKNEDDKVKIEIYDCQICIINITIHDIDDMTIKYHDEKYLKSKVKLDGRVQVLKNVLLEYIGKVLLEQYYYPICKKLNIVLNFDSEFSDHGKILVIQKSIINKNQMAKYE